MVQDGLIEEVTTNASLPIAMMRSGQRKLINVKIYPQIISILLFHNPPKG